MSNVKHFYRLRIAESVNKMEDVKDLRLLYRILEVAGAEVPLMEAFDTFKKEGEDAIEQKHPDEH